MSREVIITYGKDLAHETLVSYFQSAGTLTAIRTVAETTATRTTKLTFETPEQARRAERKKDLSLLETTSRKESTNRDPSPISALVKSEVHVVQPRREVNPIDPNRIFCLLPWTGRKPTMALKLLAEQKVEKEFFRHFARFSLMEYYYTIQDNRQRLSHVFVKYHNHRDASLALQNSEAK